jgi:Integral membrane protein TerC family
MDAFITSAGILALVTLTFLEVVLGVDNVIFISVLSNKLPASQQSRASPRWVCAPCCYSPSPGSSASLPHSSPRSDGPSPDGTLF